jgi:hypothetical protein
MSFYSDYRLCAFCRQGASGLIKYSTRRYAHAACLVECKGIDFVYTLPLCPREQALAELAKAKGQQ